MTYLPTAFRLLGLAVGLWAGLAVAQPLPLLPDPAPPPSLPQSAPANPPTRAGTAAVSATVSMEVLDDTRRLSRGDIVNVRVVEDRDPPVALQVTDSGDLEVPYIGRVRAEGKTPRELAFEIKSLLEREYYHQATVILGLDVEGQRSPGLIYVTGMVGSPGPLQIPPNEAFTVSKAILRAGGFATFANQRKVKLTRTQSDGTTDTKIVDVKQIIEKGRPDLDMEVLPNDLIIVPERLINF
jgi:protein involved in polysaccharide export with SLBB domain